MKKYFIWMLIAAFFVVNFSACSTSDWVLNVDPLIDRIADASLDDEESMAFLVKGVNARFAQHIDNLVSESALLSDEGIFDENVPLATYSVYNQLSQNIGLILETTNGNWNAGQGYRFHADNLLERASAMTFEDASIEKDVKFTGAFHGGIARYFLATYWGLNEEEGGAVISTRDTPGEFIPSNSMYTLAIEKFNSSLQFSPNAAMTRVINSLIARSYLFKGDYSSARTSAAAGMVEGDSPYQALYSTESTNNWWSNGGKGRTQIAIDFRFYKYVLADPKEANRVKLYEVLGTGVSPRYPGADIKDGHTVYHFQLVYPDRDDPINFMDWQENELMLAELDLRDGNTASALTRINSVRASHSIDPKDATALNTDILGILGMNLLVVERDKELFTRGIRLVDQRANRFDIWHLPAAWQAQQHAGWRYFPIPNLERDANPNLPSREGG